MKHLKVLHIVNWYPTEENRNQAIWIKRQVEAIAPYTEINEVLHIQVIPGSKFKFNIIKDNNLKHIIWKVPFKSWFIIEILSFFLLVKELFKRKVNNNYSVINFHIAYPLLTYFHLFKKFVKIPVVISEHWSAYHFNFGVKKKLKRVQKIFNQGIPVLAVSKSLIGDIKSFSGNKEFKNYVVPNIVDTDVFKLTIKNNLKNPTFFMLSQWKWPKNPIIILEAFAVFLLEFKTAKLRVGGFGNLYPYMKKKVKELNIDKHVVFLDSLNSTEIAEEMNKATAFLHCSDYETFSVVCAEALCCGCPVIASNVGGLKEFIQNNNGLLVSENSKERWVEALFSFQNFNFLPTDISTEAKGKFSKEIIAIKYYSYLKLISHNKTNGS